MVSTFKFADDVVGILITEDLDLEKISEVHKLILERVEKHKKINLYVEIEEGRHISMPAFFKDVAFKFTNGNKFKRIAVVTDINWFQNAMEIKDLLMDAEVQSFRLVDRLKAISWIAE